MREGLERRGNLNGGMTGRDDGREGREGGKGGNMEGKEMDKMEG